MQLESLSKNLIYEANDQGRLKEIFDIKMLQEKYRIWTGKCPGNLETKSFVNNHSWFMSALKELKLNDMSICNHGFKDLYFYYQLDGDKLEIIDILPEKSILGSASSRKKKRIIYVDQILEENGLMMKKYKHYCMEQNISIKGRRPKWYKEIEQILTLEGSRELKPKFKEQFKNNKSISLRLYDEDESYTKENLVTWTEQNGDIIFAEDRKKSRSKTCKRIGVHLIFNTDLNTGENESPFLKKCTGCKRNTDRKDHGRAECRILIENKCSRLIKKRVEAGIGIKPYETLNSIRIKNDMMKNLEQEMSKDEDFNERIDWIDNIIVGNEDLINFLKNSIIESEDGAGSNDHFIDIFIYTSKLKKKVLFKGGITYEFLISWRIVQHNLLSDGLFFTFLIKSVEDNEYRILLRALIVSLLLIPKKQKIRLNINKNVETLLKFFQTNLSDRRNLDNEYYLELKFISTFLKNNEILWVKEDQNLLTEDREVSIKMIQEEFKNRHNFLKNCRDTIQEIEIAKDGFIVNEYNLYWKNELLPGEYRQWRKKCTNAIWKNEILNSKKIEDLFFYNFHNEFDWIKSLKFISNKNKFSSRECGKSDSQERAYKIKNLLKELPTYQTLYDRNTNGITAPICIRCNKENEDWYHVWRCEDNERTIRDLIVSAIRVYEDNLNKEGNLVDLVILKDINIQFVIILQEPSRVLLNYSREWELLRGIYNNKFNDISRNLDYRRVIDSLWEFCYAALKQDIWIPRCEEVARLEEMKGISSRDKKKQQKADNLKPRLDDNKNIEKKIKKHKTINKKEEKNNENLIRLETQDSLISMITPGTSHQLNKLWHTKQKLV